MSLKFDTLELTDFMMNFYTLTGIRIVLFDEKYKEIFAYPEECSPFCSLMRKNEGFYNLCCKCDENAFKNCKKSGALNMYKCHAGLIEATYPIINGGSIIGFVMFGQVSDSKDKNEFRNSLSSIAQQYGAKNAEEVIKKVKFKSSRQLVAAAKILEAFTSYILHKEIIKPSRIELFSAIDEYISNNLNEEITVDSLCRKFNISRTRLYALCSNYIQGGISAYIKTKRLLKAKELLKTSQMSVSDIAHEVGFSDYNYFLKSFKRHFGVSTKAIKKGV